MSTTQRDNRILWLPGEERMWDDDAGSRTAAGVRIDANNAHTVPAVFACLRVIAETVASLPLHVLERTPGGGKRIARELPLYRQLHAQPNGWQTSFEWREQAVFHVGLWGDSFSELKAGEIQPLHPSRMKIERLENGRLRYQYREEKGTQRPINESLILQVRGPSDDGVNGLRIVEECKDAIALARACELHGARFFGNGARPGFVLSTDGSLNAEAREQLRSQWDRRHAGVGNSHSTAVLTGGLKPYEIPQSSNSDAQFLELRRYQLEEIARLYRCPGWLLGIGTAGPQSEMEFVTHTVLPWLRRFESAFMRDLIADDDRYLIEFDVRGLMRGDAASRSAYYRSMWDIGVLSTDDIRELENMDPVEGGEVRYRPLNMGTLGAPPSVEDVLAQQQPGSGIDGQAVEGGVAAAEGEAEPVAEPASETSLTTAEVSSLLTVVKQITDGLLSIDAARAIIAAAFPVLSPARVETILQGVQAPEPEPVAEPVAASLPASRDCGTGSGGFKPGNKCGGEGSGSDAGNPGSQGGGGTATPEVKAWAERKFDNPEHAKAFTEWFGNSKVVDEKGEPIVVYHGTGAGFDEFQPSAKGMLGPGIYASADKNDYGPYSPYAGKDNAQVKPLYMSIKNPHYAIAGDTKTFDAPEGTDGTILIDRRTKKILWAVAKTPTSVKSATGNSGTFDPSDPKITRSVPPAERAAPGSIVEGQWVTFGDGLIGRVDHVMTEGVLNLGDIEMPASPEAPVMLVSVWADGNFGEPVAVAMADAELVDEPEDARGYKVGKRKPRKRKEK